MKKTLVATCLLLLLYFATPLACVRGNPGGHISVINSPVPLGHSIQIEFSIDPGDTVSGVALYILNPSGGSDLWDYNVPYAVIGGTAYTETAPGLSTPGTYTAGIVEFVGGMSASHAETTFQVAGGGPGAGFDFSLILSPSSLTVKQGETANYQIFITYSDPSYSGTSVEIQVSGLGPGMDYQVIPSPPTLRILTSSSTPAGSYSISLSGFANGVIHQTSATLIVESAMTRYAIDWVLSNPSLSPPSPKVGDSVIFNVVLTQASSDWPGSLSVGVRVKLDGSPFDMVWIYQNQPGPIPVGTTKTASTKSWTATAGTHSVTWTLEFFGGDQTVILADPTPNDDDASLQFSVAAQASDFRIDVNPPSRTATQGETATYQIDIVSLNGFNSQVTLSVSGLPTGAEGVFTTPSGTPNFGSALTVTLPTDAPAGSYTLEVKGEGGGLSRTANLVLKVRRAAETSTTQTSTETSTTSSNDIMSMLQQNSLLILAVVVALAAAALVASRRKKPSVQAPTTQGPQSGVTYCPSCGHQNPAGNKFCSGCGAKL
jgi:hypothetical protein